jgi:hypothetical protein
VYRVIELLQDMELLAYNYHFVGEIYRMVPLYVLDTKIYQYVAKFFQIGQIIEFQRIDSVSDYGAPPVRPTWLTQDDGG